MHPWSRNNLITGKKSNLDGELMDRNTKRSLENKDKNGICFPALNLFPNMTVLENCKLAQIEVLHKSDAEAETVALEYL